ncbi:MAG: hypothetical protein HFH45_02470 [Bacilli bacterium]|nr:hypothetical protein [Bacilli bacterium]
MKKILVIIFSALFILTGCDSKLDNTPTKKVEEFLNNYQSLDSKVMEDLDTTLAADPDLNEDNKSEYKEFMKKHYQDLKYEIKDEKIDGDKATVETEITVRNYTKSVAESENYKSENAAEFNGEDGNYDATLFSTYRLDELKKVTDTETYTITFNLTKQDDIWKLEDLSDEDLNKINGLYAG